MLIRWRGAERLLCRHLITARGSAVPRERSCRVTGAAQAQRPHLPRPACSLVGPCWAAVPAGRCARSRTCARQMTRARCEVMLGRHDAGTRRHAMGPTVDSTRRDAGVRERPVCRLFQGPCCRCGWWCSAAHRDRVNAVDQTRPDRRAACRNVRQLDAVNRELLAPLWAAGAGPRDLTDLIRFTRTWSGQWDVPSHTSGAQQMRACQVRTRMRLGVDARHCVTPGCRHSLSAT